MTPAGKMFDAVMHLLDRQVLDVDKMPVTVADDVELSDIPSGRIPPGTAAPVITNLLAGSVLGTRMFGGRPPSSRLNRIHWRHVAELGTALRLNIRGDQLDVLWTERWVRNRIIGRIPGGRHDPE
ncbi:hypothetical protein ACMX2H_05450 [Arthrobacter sulfonylureivorans]|uniref:hypothetical protein n=1 Tax=Arthrobacter sulfonylureivorans TaxID=2486855 RepID=UPI0039E426F0